METDRHEVTLNKQVVKPEFSRIILTVQSVHYLLTGLWPLVHVNSFMEVTGYRTDLWLVKTVSVLTVAIAIAFIVDLWSKESSTAIAILSVIAAMGFLGIDLYYCLTDEIHPIYLVDAVVQLAFVWSWGLLSVKTRF